MSDDRFGRAVDHNTISNSVSTLEKLLRCWPSIETALGRCVMVAE